MESDGERSFATAKRSAFIILLGSVKRDRIGFHSVGTSARLAARLHANSAKPGKFQRRPAYVEAEHRAQEIDLKPFDPADGEAEVACERNKDAGA